jgi:hypothetical protein
MNIKPLIPAIIVSRAVLFARDFLIHHLWLGPVYVSLALGHRAILPFLARHTSFRVVATVVAALLTVCSRAITLLLNTRLVFE